MTVFLSPTTSKNGPMTPSFPMAAQAVSLLGYYARSRMDSFGFSVLQ